MAMWHGNVWLVMLCTAYVHSLDELLSLNIGLYSTMEITLCVEGERCTLYQWHQPALCQKEPNLFAAQNFTCIVGKCLQDHRLMKDRAQLTRVIIWPIVLVGHWELKSKKVWSVLKIVQMDGTKSSGHTCTHIYCSKILTKDTVLTWSSQASPSPVLS